MATKTWGCVLGCQPLLGSSRSRLFLGFEVDQSSSSAPHHLDSRSAREHESCHRTISPANKTPGYFGVSTKTTKRRSRGADLQHNRGMQRSSNLVTIYGVTATQTDYVVQKTGMPPRESTANRCVGPSDAILLALNNVVKAPASPRSIMLLLFF